MPACTAVRLQRTGPAICRARPDYSGSGPRKDGLCQVCLPESPATACTAARLQRTGPAICRARQARSRQGQAPYFLCLPAPESPADAPAIPAPADTCPSSKLSPRQKAGNLDCPAQGQRRQHNCAGPCGNPACLEPAARSGAGPQPQSSLSPQPPGQKAARLAPYRPAPAAFQPRQAAPWAGCQPVAAIFPGIPPAAAASPDSFPPDWLISAQSPPVSAFPENSFHAAQAGAPYICQWSAHFRPAIH